jgi:hypothetical protein
VASSICFLLGYLSHTCIDSFRGDTASASDTAEVVRVVDDDSKDVEANEFYYRASVGPSSTLMELARSPAERGTPASSTVDDITQELLAAMARRKANAKQPAAADPPLRLYNHTKFT